VAERVSECEDKGEKPDPSGLYFRDEVFGGAVPREYIPSVEFGFRDSCRKCAKYGFPCVDIEASLLDGKSHEVDSSQQAFELCSIECFREAQSRAGLVLLEPIMNVVVHAPGQYLGDLTRDVSRRRGEILNSSLDKGRCQLHAYVPLAELFGYTSELRNFTSGTASFTMEPSHYQAVKEELADLRAAS
jgi:elongation factor G